MPRRNRPRGRGPGPDSRSGPTEGPGGVRYGLGGARAEQGPRGDESETYLVRQIPAAPATATYRCPGCDHPIPPRTPHVVAWRADDPDAGDRRHWHSGCWRGRSGRSVTRRWS